MKACRNNDAIANCYLCNKLVYDKAKQGNVVEKYYYIGYSGEGGQIFSNQLIIVICEKCFKENSPIEFIRKH